ncbi:MAG: hypothetical protein AAF623_09095, partial [Planctomycetota bacterium]
MKFMVPDFFARQRQEDLVGRLLGAIGQGHKLSAADRKRLVDEALTTKADALGPLITAVEFLA